MSILDLLLGQPQNSMVQNNTPGINPAAPNPFESLSGGRKGGILNNRLLLNLMAGSGFSTMPDSPIGAFGRAALATQQQEQDERQLGIRERMLQQRIGTGTQSPAAVREFEFFESLGNPDKPDEISEAQKRYLAVRRAQQIEDIPGVGLSRVLPGGVETITPEPTIQAGLGDRAEASEAGTQRAAIAAIPERARAQDLAETAQQLPKQTDEVERFSREGEAFIRQLESGELDTGFFIGQFPAISTEAQLFEVFSGDQVLEKISSATFGALSEGEREFLRTTVTSRDKTPAANIAIIRRKIDILSKAEARSREKLGLSNDDFSGFSIVPPQ